MRLMESGGEENLLIYTSWFSGSTSVTTPIHGEWLYIHEIYRDATTSTTGKAGSPNLNLNVNSLSFHSLLVPISDFDHGVKC